MRLFALIFTTLVAAVLSAALPGPIAARSRPVKADGGLRGIQAGTNAERFARGLPPLSPSKTSRKGSSIRQAVVSPGVPVTYQGSVEVYQSSTGTFLGWLSKSSGSGAYEYAFDATDVLVVSVTIPLGQVIGTNLNVLTVNSQINNAHNNPYLGLSGEAQYLDANHLAWLSGVAKVTSETTNGASSYYGTGNIESGVWTVDVTNGNMAPTWTNPDGTIPYFTLFKSADSNAIFFGDYGVYSQSDLTQVYFKFVG